MGTVPKSQQLFKCAKCNDFARMTAQCKECSACRNCGTCSTCVDWQASGKREESRAWAKVDGKITVTEPKCLHESTEDGELFVCKTPSAIEVVDPDCVTHAEPRDPVVALPAHSGTCSVFEMIGDHPCPVCTAAAAKAEDAP